MYIDSLVNIYTKSVEYEKRYLLGENPICIDFDLSNSIYYDKGINSVHVEIEPLNKKYKYDIKETNFNVDCKFLQEYEEQLALVKDLGISDITVTTNREDLKELIFITDYESFEFALKDYTGIRVNFYDNCYITMTSLSSFLHEFGQFDDCSISLELTLETLELLKKICECTKIDALTLKISPNSNHIDDYYGFYKDIHDRLKCYGFYNKRNVLGLCEKHIMRLLDNESHLSQKGLNLFMEMNQGVSDILLI